VSQTQGFSPSTGISIRARHNPAGRDDKCYISVYDSLETQNESIYITKYGVDSTVVMVDTPACTPGVEGIVASSRSLSPARKGFVKGRDLQPDATFVEVVKLPTSPAGAVGPFSPFLPDFVFVEISPLVGTETNGGLVTTS
jgi:hypothetical protein